MIEEHKAITTDPIEKSIRTGFCWNQFVPVPLSEAPTRFATIAEVAKVSIQYIENIERVSFGKMEFKKLKRG